MKPYWRDDKHDLTIYHGDCLEIMPGLSQDFDLCLTDPPYPNNAAHFEADIEVAREVLRRLSCPEACVFWSELDSPPLVLPQVALHIWHRTNVNGRPYEAIYHFAKDGLKRRSQIRRWAAVFGGVGPGCWEYQGHPTQKPVGLMQWLLEDVAQVSGLVLDPFLGSGTTLVACYRLGRAGVGIEICEEYCELSARRLEKEIAQGRLWEPGQIEKPKQEPLIAQA